MSFFKQTNSAFARFHDSLCHDIVVHQYAWDPDGGTNEYASGDWTESTVTVSGTIRVSSESADVDASESGPDRDGESTIYVPTDDVDVSIGTGEQSRATEFTDTETGQRYEAVSYQTQGPLYAITTVLSEA